MSLDPWKRIDVSEWLSVGTETLGSAGAEWLQEPSGKLWLCKPVRRIRDDTLSGQDWAEVAATVVARQLDIPCARTQLAIRHGVNCVLSLRLHDPDQYDFREGQVFLEDSQNIRVVDEQTGCPPIVRKGHSLSVIRSALSQTVPPPEWQPSIDEPNINGFSLFVGYLCLDMLIANQDRHEQNWAVLEPTVGTGPLVLAGSYDHGSSFGYGLLPTKRRDLLKNPDKLTKWCSKGNACRLQHFKKLGPSTLLEAAMTGLQLTTLGTKEHWIRKFSELNIESVAESIESGRDSVEDDAAMDFVIHVVTINQRRFREAADTIASSPTGIPE